MLSLPLPGSDPDHLNDWQKKDPPVAIRSRPGTISGCGDNLLPVPIMDHDPHPDLDKDVNIQPAAPVNKRYLLLCSPAINFGRGHADRALDFESFFYGARPLRPYQGNDRFQINARIKRTMETHLIHFDNAATGRPKPFGRIAAVNGAPALPFYEAGPVPARRPVLPFIPVAAFSPW